jgi:hypothetical protein
MEKFMEKFMKKSILLGGALCLLTSFSANARIYEYPGTPHINRANSDYQYWHQIRIAQEREEAGDNRGDEGNHYAYGKGHKKHKKHKKHVKHHQHDQRDHNGR